MAATLREAAIYPAPPESDASSDGEREARVLADSSETEARHLDRAADSSDASDDDDAPRVVDRLAQRQASYEVHETHDMLTQDHEDHTFNGVIFTVECLDRAVERVVVRGVAVRGELGPVTVWAARGRWHEDRGFREDPRRWTLCHQSRQGPSYRAPRLLELEAVVALEPGEVASIYVHSALRDDTGVVYDNWRGSVEDTYLRVGPACAHLSNVPFNGHHPWGAWRNRRSFVGTLSYGVRHLLWQPERKVHSAFPAPFREMVRTLLVLNRHSNSYLADLPVDVLFYVVHMLPAWSAPAAHEKNVVAAAASRARPALARALK
eukprot:CAMPEP_0119269806 /NCGR_PEP_ID=MMETSP1329-20130426/7060_1 /TAXON_ID=114041 /ORGANISM="Genus nov. species nov., Strain RCC1024" /LENGTH=320 /DNA_ID=CAMNT_0007269807 /DNA_START=145 /DNA_END=1104 /DNA_ORIENTATION=-